MKGHCPKCGSAASFVSQKSSVIGFSEAVFKCTGPKCGSEVIAEIRFSTPRASASRCFSASGETLEEHIKTDC